MRRRRPLHLLPALLLPALLAACAPPAGESGQSAQAAQAESPLLGDDPAEGDCSLEAAWDEALALGLRRDPESARQLTALKTRKECAPEIRKLAEILLDDRVAERHPQLEVGAKVRFSAPDLHPLHLGKQPSQPIAIAAEIDAKGRVTAAEMTQAHSDPRINQLFLDTASTWLFRPASQKGVYVASRQTFTANVHVR